MTELLRCLPLCSRILPHHLLKTLPQQERQQFYRSRKLVGEMKRLQPVHVSVIICGPLRSRLTPQTRKRWQQLPRGCTASTRLHGVHVDAVQPCSCCVSTSNTSKKRR